MARNASEKQVQEVETTSGVWAKIKNIFSKNTGNEKKSGMNKKRRNELIFYYSWIALPILQVLVFYVAVNINSILLAFKEYKLVDGVPAFEWAGFANFKLFFTELTAGTVLPRMFLNSLTFYAFGLLVGVTLALLFSFYIYKKYFMSEFFRVMLFLPSIISSIVLIYMYRYLIDYGIVAVAETFGKTIEPPLSKPDGQLWIMLLFNTAIGFGTSTIMYANAMSRIPVSVTEYARLDGVTPMREFVSITIPMIFPTLSTFLVAGIASIFVNQANLYSMFATNADYKIRTLGYDLFLITVHSTGESKYPEAAAYGLVYTLIACPLTIGIKKLLDKVDPNVQY